MPRLVEDDLIAELGKQPIPCAAVDGGEHGQFFVMRGGSSTDEDKRNAIKTRDWQRQKARLMREKG